MNWIKTVTCYLTIEEISLMFCTSVSPSPTKLLICYLGVILDTIEYAKVYKVNLHLQVVQLALQLIL